MVNNRNLISDNFSFASNDENEMFEKLKEISSNTKVEKVDLSQIQMLHFEKETENRIEYIFMDYTPLKEITTTIENFDKKVLEKKDLLKKKIDIQEVVSCSKTNPMMITREGHLYFLSNMAIQSLNQKVGLGCDFFSNHSFIRSLGIREATRQRELPVVFISRQKGLFRKTFYIGGEHYYYLPLDKVEEVVKSLKTEIEGGLKFNSGIVTQEKTQLLYTMPEMEERVKKKYKIPFKPCVVIENSDTGNSSLIIKSAWIKGINRSYMLQNEFSQAHRGKMDFEKISKDAKNYIFKDFFALPEKMMELALIDVIDVSVPKSSRREKYEELLEFYFQELNLEKILGKKRVKAVKEQMTILYDVNNELSASDLVLSIMDIPEHLKLVSFRQEKLSKAIYEAPFVDLKKFSSFKIVF